jgi:tRNA U34 5-carboxymethylaminomethyl modifying GTPase MnmE/TrmE
MALSKMQKVLKPFYDSLEQIWRSNENIEQRRGLLKQETTQFNSKVQGISLDTTLKSKNPELFQLLENTVNSIKVSSENWVKNFDQMMEKEKFREDLKNYFIVIIFGKVKAGKSTLGNFVAKNRLKTQDVSFFKYDQAGKKQEIKKLEEINDDSFATNNLECTIEIQGFKLGSLAWIDTPGLGSMTPENGQLAKDYIQSADYIIYPTSSDSPLQNDEIESLKELFAQNKKVSIFITKSDSVEEDEVDDEIVKVTVNKSSENRKKQENYVKDEINKIVKDKSSLLGDIFSISTKTAREGLDKNNKELFNGSNIPEFYKTITEVVETKASKLKNEAPLSRLQSFVSNDILGSISQNIKPSFNNLNSEIEKTASDLNRKILTIKSDINLIIENVVSRHLSQTDKSNIQTILAEIDSEIEDEVKTAVQKNINELFQNFTFALQNFQKANYEEFEIKDKTEEISYDVRYETSSGLRKFGNTVTFGLIERTYSTYRKSETIKVGDNKSEVIHNFKQSRLETHVKNVEAIYLNLENSFFKPLKSKSTEMKNILESFENRIKKAVNV